jgi:tRNA(Ile)-lysidine synthase TilS/MesJ
LVASPINETARLDDLPLNRSNTIAIRLLSGDKNLSPVIDTMNSSISYIRNRLNQPINDYALDSRVKLNSNDPHAGVYISNRVDLKQPATSLQVFISAQRAESADFRVLYKLFNSEIPDAEQSYDLFPGFDNLLDKDGDGFGDEVINAARNSGRPDAKIPSSTDNEFLEYQFTVDNLSEFTGFVIKVVFSGTNEAEAPRLSDLRAIALA